MKKNLHVYLHILCADTKFRKKNDIFVNFSKKDKKNSREKAYFTPNFVFLHGHIKKLVILGTTLEA
jgi:hypothetical protein